MSKCSRVFLSCSQTFHSFPMTIPPNLQAPQAPHARQGAKGESLQSTPPPQSQHTSVAAKSLEEKSAKLRGGL